MAEFRRKKKKICQMCAGKSVDYKDVMIINKYISSFNSSILIDWRNQKNKSIFRRKKRCLHLATIMGLLKTYEEGICNQYNNFLGV